MDSKQVYKNVCEETPQESQREFRVEDFFLQGGEVEQAKEQVYKNAYEKAHKNAFERALQEGRREVRVETLVNLLLQGGTVEWAKEMLGYTDEDIRMADERIDALLSAITKSSGNPLPVYPSINVCTAKEQSQKE